MRFGASNRIPRNKKVYDPSSYLAFSETAMTDRVKQAANDLLAIGKTMFAS
jgi:fructose/tagatose bisphosphate aldolase